MVRPRLSSSVANRPPPAAVRLAFDVSQRCRQLIQSIDPMITSSFGDLDHSRYGVLTYVDSNGQSALPFDAFKPLGSSAVMGTEATVGPHTAFLV